MSSKQTIPELLLEIFGGNQYHAKAREIKGDTSYFPIEAPLTVDNLQTHLDGLVTLGAYQIIQGSDTVKWVGWDVDSTNLEEARKVTKRLLRHLPNLPYVIEFSGRKGYHILLFLSEPVKAVDAKRIVDHVRELEGLSSMGETHVECFPKQERLSRSTPKGSLLKIPLGEHPRTHDKSRFVDMYNGWENGPDLNPLDILKYRITPEELFAIQGEGPSPEKAMVDILAEYWADGKRHDMALFLCGFLVNEGWSQEQVRSLIVEICERTGDQEIPNRLQTVKTTFERAREGKTIRGRQGLAEYLPVSVMQRIAELSSLIKVPDTVVQIDDIRYAKGRPKIEGVRLASNTIWSCLNDEGSKIIQTEQRQPFWYNVEDHSVMEGNTPIWESMLNKSFGLNPRDSFSSLVTTELQLRIIRDAPYVPVYYRARWDEVARKLLVNLGGPEVYIISGKNQIETSYNGECGVLFVTHENRKHVVPDFDSTEKVDIWELLIDDLSFAKTSDAPASPEEQKELLKAWVLSFFFPEIMPTKPILSLIGQPGSGKTTAIRRLLRVLENPDADVLGIPTDKQDAFRSSIEKHRLLVIDNLEKSGVWWMVDMLNKLSTGQHIEIRKLYKTNETYTIIPRCFVALTAVSIPFSDETLFSRLLVLEMDKLEEPLPEHLLQRTISEKSPLLWADLLRKLSEVVEIIKDGKTVKAPTKSRLVDFTVFCERIKDCSSVDAELLTGGLLSMVDSQMKQLRESSQAVFLLDEWISLRPMEAAEWRSFVELFEILQSMASLRKLNFPWRNAQSLYRHFVTIEKTLAQQYQIEFSLPENGAARGPVKVRFNTENMMIK